VLPKCPELLMILPLEENRALSKRCNAKLRGIIFKFNHRKSRDYAKTKIKSIFHHPFGFNNYVLDGEHLNLRA
tara:strand:+ start:383 stop:601 length:219 start_codon:yes stop_codon:yes gene_type:complete